MANYHLRSDGTPGVCKARVGKCPLGSDRPHYENPQDARAAYEAEASRQATARVPEIPEPGTKASYEKILRAVNSRDELTGEEFEELVAYNEKMEKELERAKSTLATIADDLVKGNLEPGDKIYNIALTLKAHNKKT